MTQQAIEDQIKATIEHDLKRFLPTWMSLEDFKTWLATKWLDELRVKYQTTFKGTLCPDKPITFPKVNKPLAPICPCGISRENCEYHK